MENENSKDSEGGASVTEVWEAIAKQNSKLNLGLCSTDWQMLRSFQHRSLGLRMSLGKKASFVAPFCLSVNAWLQRWATLSPACDFQCAGAKGEGQILLISARDLGNHTTLGSESGNNWYSLVIHRPTASLPMYRSSFILHERESQSVKSQQGKANDH